MPNVSMSLGLKMVAGGFRNRLKKKPLSVSFEVTHSCTANCWHCNLGGPIKEDRMSAEGYGKILRDLDPVICCVSGGEPLARNDVFDIVRTLANPGHLPWMVVVSNGSLLTPEKFFKLKDAGMHQLSLSLDFPDERHDEFRRIPGLFDRLSRVVPDLVGRVDKDDILMNVCITGWNYGALPGIVKVAKEWGVGVNFSAYSHLRVEDKDGLVQGDAVAELKKGIEEVIGLRAQGYPVYNTPRDLWKYYRFLVGEPMPGCTAGERFVVINPDGRLTPCAMVLAFFDSQQEMYEKFSKQNTCQECFIATRANTEKTIWEFIQDNRSVFSGLIPARFRGGA